MLCYIIWNSPVKIENRPLHHCIDFVVVVQLLYLTPPRNASCDIGSSSVRRIRWRISSFPRTIMGSMSHTELRRVSTDGEAARAMSGSLFEVQR